MDNSNNGTVIRSLMEQGDLGLFGEPLSEADQKQYMEQQKKQEALNEKDGSYPGTHINIIDKS